VGVDFALARRSYRAAILTLILSDFKKMLAGEVAECQRMHKKQINHEAREVSRRSFFRFSFV
jgi:hypothetical protein